MKKLAVYILLLLILPADLLAQTVTVGTGGSEYINLQEAFDDINAGNLTGDIVLQIINNCTESGTVVLYPTGYLGNSDYNSITIYPTGSGYSISGNVNGPLIDLNGADNVIIDGRVNQTGAADLIINNTNTGASASTIRFIESATTNTIQYCIIKGSGTGSSGGVVFFSTDASGTGNDNNLIDYNHITGNGANRPVNAIYSLGSAGPAENSSNTVSNNDFFDFLNKGLVSNGIYLDSNTTTWTISGNSFYETASFVPTASVAYNALQINNTTGTGFTVTGNFIGGKSASCGGTAWTKTNVFNNAFNAINLNVGTGTASSVQNNTISNFAWSNSGAAGWTGINIAGGAVNIGTGTANTIGAATGTGSIIVTGGATNTNVYGINLSGGGTTDCRNNVIGSITAASSSASFATNFSGINKTASAGTTTISGNSIGSTSTAGSINTSSAGTGNTQSLYGINNAGTADVTINGNTITNLTNSTTNTAGSVSGIYFNGSTGTNAVRENLIHSLTTVVAATTASVYGINIAIGSATYSNNIITLGGNTQTTVYGIYEPGIISNNNNIYFNTVYIGGNPTAGNNNSYALYNNAAANTRDFRNNFFDNARSNSGTATGSHYAIYIVTTGGTITCNYNDYFAPGTGGILGYYGANMAALPVVTGQDVNSKAIDPLFAVAGGTSAGDYVPSETTLTGVSGTGILTDYNGATRVVPTMGAFEIGACTNPSAGGVIAADQIGCSPFNPAAFASSSGASGQIGGSLEYKWQQSTTGAGSGFSDIGGAGSLTYDPGSLTQTTWYKRLARVSCMSDWTGAAESNVLTATVNALPVAGAITGGNAVCMGGSLSLTSNATGTPVLTYIWMSSNPSVATVNGSGVITPVTGGSTNITYKVTDGSSTACQATSPVFTVTINALPVANPITGGSAVCMGGSLPLTPNATGTPILTYTWSSTNPSVATVNSSGVVTPVSTGSTNIRYTVIDGSSTSCSAISSPHAVTVNALPVAGAITGGNAVCMGGSLSLTSHATGTPTLTYTWASSNPAVATVNNSGVVTPVASGTTNITYTVTDGSSTACSATSPVNAVTVNVLPAINLAVNGTGSICTGTGTDITVALSESGVNYQLRNAAGNINVGSPVAGTGATINLPTGNLSSATTFNILATNATTSCSAQLTETEVVSIDPLSVGGTISGGPGSVTYGNSTGVLTLTGHTGTVVKWQKMVGTGSWADISNTTTAYNEIPASIGTWQYRAQVKSGVCTEAYSSPVSIDVLPKSLTITANDQTKIFGTTFTFLGTEFTSSGLIGSDAITGVTLISSGSPSTAGVAGSPYTITGSAAIGTGLGNYTISYTNGSFSVTKAPLTTTADAQTKVYGAVNPTLTITYSGFAGTDDQTVLDVLPSASTTAVQYSDAGTYPITPSGGSDDNYSFSYTDGTLTISKATLTVTADNKTKTYGDANPAFTVTYTGFVGTDDETVLDVLTSTSTSASQYSDVGSYAITVSGGSDNNYAFSYTDGTLTISKATLSVTADNKTKPYGALNPALTLTYTGFLGTDDVTVLDVNATVTTAALQFSDVGTYPIVASGGSDNNYTFSFTDGVLTIIKADQTITFSILANKTYGDADYTLTATAGSGLSVGFASGNTAVATVAGNTVHIVSAGSAVITASQAGDGNYNAAPDVPQTLTVSKKSLTFTADNKSKVHQTQNPVLTYVIIGYVLGETQSVLDVLPSIQTTAVQNSPVGTYPITLTGGSDNNYTYIYIPGVLTVTRFQQTISFTGFPLKLLVGDRYTLVATSTSGLIVQFESIDVTIATVSGDQLTGVSKGNVQIRAYHPGDQNYDPAEALVTVEIYSTHKDIMNLFTPNNDGFNDLWELPDLAAWGKCDVRVYNRWGKLVFADANYNNLWDGTSDGTPLPEGPYYFIIKTENAGAVKGTVNIVR